MANVWCGLLVLLLVGCSSSAPSDPPQKPPTSPDDGGTPDSGTPDAGPLGGGEWLQYRHDPRGGSNDPGVFEAAQAANLRPAWSITDDRLGLYVYTQALITTDAVIFTTAFGGKVVALDPRDGHVLWSRVINGPVATACRTASYGFWAAGAIADGVLYVAAADGLVHALRPADGAELWSVRVADNSLAGHGEYVETSPAVSLALGKLYVGVASSDKCDPIAGRVASVDLGTHAVQSTQIAPVGAHGGSVWASLSVDEAAGRVYAATGNHLDPLDDPAMALTQSLVSFDARTLAVLDHWQNPTSLSNSDFGSSPALFEASAVPLVASASKDGWLYVLRRDALAAGPVWKYQLAVVDPAHPTEGGDPTHGFGSIVSPTFANGTLYAAGGRTPSGKPGSVVAFDPGTGTVKWIHDPPGYVMAAMPAVGDVLVVESSAPDNTTSWLEVLDQRTGAQLRLFSGVAATYAAPSVGRGLIVWSDAEGRAQAFEVPAYRP